MLKKINIFMFLLLFSNVITTLNVQANENINGDIESIKFDIETENPKIKLLESDPLPALYSDTQWIGVADTSNFSFEGGSFASLFDNDTTTFVSWSSPWTLTAKFEKSIVLKDIRLAWINYMRKGAGGGNTGIFDFEFYNGSTLVHKQTFQPKVSVPIKIDTIPVNKVVTSVKLIISIPSYNYINALYEMEFYEDEAITYESVKEITAMSTVDQIDLSYENPDSIYMNNNIIKINGETAYEGKKKKIIHLMD